MLHLQSGNQEQYITADQLSMHQSITHLTDDRVNKHVTLQGYIQPTISKYVPLTTDK